MAISYGKMVIIGAGKVGSAILNSVLRMNILDEIVVVNRNQKKALGEVLDAAIPLLSPTVPTPISMWAAMRSARTPRSLW